MTTRGPRGRVRPKGKKDRDRETERTMGKRGTREGKGKGEV